MLPETRANFLCTAFVPAISVEDDAPSIPFLMNFASFNVRIELALPAFQLAKQIAVEIASVAPNSCVFRFRSHHVHHGKRRKRNEKPRKAKVTHGTLVVWAATVATQSLELKSSPQGPTILRSHCPNGKEN